MQQTQQNYNLILGLAGLLAAFGMGAPALAGIAARSAPQPLLNGGESGPCDPRLDGPDYVPGVDVNGNPVAPADLARARNPVPDGVLVPLKGRGRQRHARSGESPVVALDGKTLDPILNPAPACPPGRR